MATRQIKRQKNSDPTEDLLCQEPPVVDINQPLDYTDTDIYRTMLPSMDKSLVDLVDRMNKMTIEENEFKDRNGVMKKNKSMGIPKDGTNEKTLVGINTNRLIVSDTKLAGFGVHYVSGTYYPEKTFTDSGSRGITFRVLPPPDWIVNSEKYQVPGMLDTFIKQNICFLIIVKQTIEEFVNKIMEQPLLFKLELQNYINVSCKGLYDLDEITSDFIAKYSNMKSQKEKDRFNLFLSNLKRNVLPATDLGFLTYGDIVSFLEKFFGEFEHVTPLLDRVKQSLGTVEIKSKTVPKVLYMKCKCRTYNIEEQTLDDGKKVRVEVPYFPDIGYCYTVRDPKTKRSVEKTIKKTVTVELLEKNRENIRANVPENMLFPIGVGDAVSMGGVIIINPKTDGEGNAHPKLTIRMSRLTRMNAAPPLPLNTMYGYIEGDVMNEFNDFEEYDEEINHSNGNNTNAQSYSITEPSMDVNLNDINDILAS